MAAAQTYEPIATSTVSGSTTRSVTVSSIPGTYTDLILVTNGTAVGPSDCTIYFNGSQATNYSWTRLYGNGSTTSSTTTANQDGITIGTLWTTIGNTIISIQNYANTTTYKSILSRNNSPSNYVGAFAGLWRSTAAITSVTFYSGNEYISAGTVVSLYGIKAA